MASQARLFPAPKPAPCPVCSGHPICPEPLSDVYTESPAAVHEARPTHLVPSSGLFYLCSVWALGTWVARRAHGVQAWEGRETTYQPGGDVPPLVQLLKATRRHETVIRKQKYKVSGKTSRGKSSGREETTGLRRLGERRGKNKGSQEREGCCCEVPAPSGRSGRAAKHRATQGFGGDHGGRGGGPAARGCGSSPRPPASGAPPRRPCRPRRHRHAAPAPPRSRVTFPLPRLPAARPRLGPEDATGFARVRAGGPNTSSSRRKSSPAAASGPEGVEGSLAPPLVPACLRKTHRSIAAPFLPGLPLAGAVRIPLTA